MSSAEQFSIDNDGYFGVTLLDMGKHGSDLIANRVYKTVDLSRLHFDDASAIKIPEHRAVTIEGDAVSISNPTFALQSLLEYARIAREMDDLHHQWAS